MSVISYHEQEYTCEHTFSSLGPIYHIYSPENYKTFLFTEEDFIEAMNIFGIICGLYRKKVRVITFEFMNNHFHVLVAGKLEECMDMMRLFINLLQRKMDCLHKKESIKDITISYVVVNDLDYARNCIAYINRNGFLVSHDWSPMTYPWGANRMFFNDELKDLHQRTGREVKQVERREITRSRKFDNIDGLLMVNGIISPISYCEITFGEKLFRDGRHYFNLVTKAIEQQASIAKQLGETIFMTDSELYRILMSISRTDYKVSDAKELSNESKVELAIRLHNDYHASNKQISRMLNIPTSTITALFGA